MSVGKFSKWKEMNNTKKWVAYFKNEYHANAMRLIAAGTNYEHFTFLKV
jgi:hypothetical protein